MDSSVVTREAARVELGAGAVLKETWRLYKRLFVRSLVLGLVVFGTVRLVDGLSRTGHGSAVAAMGLLSIVLSFAGVALLEGGLVEIVRGLHDDGDADESFGGVMQNAGGRLGKLVAVSLLTRSEEHTSELQSRGHLVCRLLLEKKKNTLLRLLLSKKKKSKTKK